MIHFFDKAKASISVFLILVLVPMYTCAYLAIDSARYFAAKAKVGGAMELTGNAALADYDKTSKELFGIFLMSKSEEDLATNLISYYSSMIDITDSSSLSKDVVENTVNTVFENTVNTKTVGFSANYNQDSSICNPTEMEKQIRSFMKYRAPYEWINGISQKVLAFTQAEEVSDVIDSSSDYYKSLSGLEDILKEIFVSLQEVSNEDNDKKADTLKEVKKSVSNLKDEVESSSSQSNKWNESVEKMEEGELKQLLKGEYESSAGAIDLDSIGEFSSAIESDIKSLKDSEEDIELTYKNTRFYSYISSMYGGNSTSSEDAKSQKNAAEAIAKTDLGNLTGEVDSIEIPTLVSEKILKTISSAEGTDISIKGFGKIKNAALNSYEMEYISSMFGCLTSKETDINLMGSTFSNRPILKGEIEYIVFGKDNMTTNVALCVDLIFSIRLIMNSVYVYTNANMRQSALVAATAIAGWTGVGIPVAQNALLIAWAMAESVLDTSSLCKGETVPIYKSASTWTLGLSGMTSTLAEGTANYASKKIDDVFEIIENTSIEKVEDIKDATLSYMSQTSQGAVESLTSMVVTPVEKAVISMTSGIQTSYSKEDVRNIILKAVDSVDGSSKGVVAAKKLFVDNCLDSLTDKVYSNLPSFATGDKSAATYASEEISKAIDDAYKTLFSKVEATVDTYTKSLEDEMISISSKASNSIKEETVNAINRYAQSISEYVGKDTEGSISSYSGMGMSYKDYLKLFTLIGLSSKEGKENILKRCAIVMQIDCSKRNKKFDITKCYTAVTLCSRTQVGSHTIKLEEVYSY